jgi:hypothetical protein
MQIATAMTSIDPSVAALKAAVAEELRHVGRLVEALAEILVVDDHFTAAYLDQLQIFDLVVQSANESADLLDRLSTGATAHEAIAPVRLGAIQGRLRAALNG